MGKQLIIVRHAKSSWADSDIDDFDRPLNERGKNDAPVMASRLSKAGFHPELIVSSPAKRALSTARIFAEVLSLGKEEILKIPELYHATATQILTRCKDLPVNASSVAIFGHNPGLTEFVNMVSPFEIDNIPTSGIVVLEIPKWVELGTKLATARWFDYPKAHQG